MVPDSCWNFKIGIPSWNFKTRRQKLTARQKQIKVLPISSEIILDQDNQEIDKVNLVGYGMVRPCCYNAARLGDTYCMCGRSIPHELKRFIISE